MGNNLYSHLLILDVCGTLYKGNSTDDFIWFTAKQKFKVIDYIIYFILARVFLALYTKKIRKAKKRHLIALFFKGMKEKEMRVLSEDFFSLYYLERCSLGKISQYLDKYTSTILVSASIDPPISMLAQYLKYDFYSSILEVSNGYYTGSFVSDIL
jgi:phosphoserine phosphatase